MSGRVRPLLVIGLDVGDGTLIRRWAGEGALPTLASLLERGSWSRLETPAELLHVSAWPSLYTGTHPGEHGVYYTFQARPGLQGWAKFGGDWYGRPTFWNLLARAGGRCVVFDAPYTHPEPGSEAVQIFEWGTWAHHWRPASSPRGLFRRLRRGCGRYPLGLEALDVGLSPLDPEVMRGRLVRAAAAKGEATRWLMREGPWDLFVVVFAETHPAAHYCMDPSEPAGPQRAMRDVYRAVDGAIAGILEEAGPEADVLVVSGDGVAPNRAAWHLLPEVLRRLGWLVEPTASGAAAGGAAAGSGGGEGAGARPRDPVRMIRDLLPKDFRKSLARRLPDALRHRLARRVDTAGIDWSRTRAYCLPTDLEGYVRINLRGREPQGIVSPQEYGAVCGEIASALGELVVPGSGRPAVRSVVRTEEAFPGPRRDRLPDLIVLWEGEGPGTALASPAVGTVTGESPDGRSGTHSPPGFLLAAGDDVAEALEIRHVCEVAPAILSRFGEPVPEHMGVAPDRAVPNRGGRA